MTGQAENLPLTLQRGGISQQAEHYPTTKAIYTLLSTLGNGTELAAALGVRAMVFLSVAIMGAAVLGGKRGGLFKL